MTKLPDKIHASLGASSAHRWMNCPGSVALYGELPPGSDPSSIYAREGTAAHALGELCLRKDGNPEAFLGVELEGIEVTNDMIDAVKVYVDFCRSLLVDGCRFWIEKRFSLGILNPPAPMFGTGDFGRFLESKRELHIVDYKHGSGVVVEVQDNPQLMYYGLGMLLTVEQEVGRGKIDWIYLTIVQPRAGHPDGVIRTIRMSYEDLLAFTLMLLRRARATIESGAPRQTGAWCRWCNAAAICPERAAESMAVAQSEFNALSTVSPPEPSSLTPEDLSWVLRQLPALEEWVRQVYSHATVLAESGHPVPGFKLVEKRQMRYWQNEASLKAWADVIGLTDDELHDRKLRSVAQVEKVVGKGRIPEELIDKRSSGTTLVPEEDKRPALVAGSDEFEPVEQG